MEARKCADSRGQTCGQPRARGSVVGEGWSPGAAGLSPPPLARWRTGAGCPPPGPRPRSGPHGGARRNDHASWANARTANGHEHQGDEANRPQAAGKGQRLGACVVGGEVRSPNHHRGMVFVSRNLSRAPTASLRADS